jgi:hypothetical protein
VFQMRTHKPKMNSSNPNYISPMMPTFDSDGYPSEETLQQITDWPINDPHGWFEFIRRTWDSHYGTIREADGKINFVTGGWSGNESIISAMRENFILWTIHWVSIHRGGLVVMELPKQTQQSQ